MTDRTEIARRWTAMWNLELPAAEIVRADAGIRFGRLPVVPRDEPLIGPAGLQAVVDATAARLDGPVFGIHRVVPGDDAELMTVLWYVEAAALDRRSGLDLLRVADGLVAEAWSITGDLPLD